MGGEVSSDLTLADYIRQNLELRGTKYMCREAGCGACIVSVVKCPGGPVEAVNSVRLISKRTSYNITSEFQNFGNLSDCLNCV